DQRADRTASPQPRSKPPLRARDRGFAENEPRLEAKTAGTSRKPALAVVGGSAELRRPHTDESRHETKPHGRAQQDVRAILPAHPVGVERLAVFPRPRATRVAQPLLAGILESVQTARDGGAPGCHGYTHKPPEDGRRPALTGRFRSLLRRC